MPPRALMLPIPTGVGHPKKSRGLLREGDPVTVYRFIDAEKATWSVRCNRTVHPVWHVERV